MHPRTNGTRPEWVVVVTWQTQARERPLIKVHGQFTEAVAKKYATRLRDTEKFFPEDLTNIPKSAIKMLSAIARPIEKPERGIL